MVQLHIFFDGRRLLWNRSKDGRIGGKIAVFLCVPAGCHINFAAVVIRCIGHQRTVRLFSRHGSQNTCPACFHQFPDVFAHRQLLLNSLNYGGILTQDHQKYEKSFFGRFFSDFYLSCTFSGQTVKHAS
jgi:hypothetical protein